MSQTKSLPITKLMVYKAYQKVKANQGSAGVDGGPPMLRMGRSKSGSV
jgi:hypothetical protein